MQAVAIAEAMPAGREGRLAEGIEPSRSVRLGLGPAPISHQQTGIGQCQCKCHVMPCNASRGHAVLLPPCPVPFDNNNGDDGPLESNSSFLGVLSLSLLTSVDSKNERFSNILAVCTVLCNIRLLIAARHGCKAHHASPDQPGHSSTSTCEPRTADNSSESPVPGTCLIIGRARQSRLRPGSRCSQYFFSLPFFCFKAPRSRVLFDLKRQNIVGDGHCLLAADFKAGVLCQLVLRCTCQRGSERGSRSRDATPWSRPTAVLLRYSLVNCVGSARDLDFPRLSDIVIGRPRPRAHSWSFGAACPKFDILVCALLFLLVCSQGLECSTALRSSTSHCHDPAVVILASSANKPTVLRSWWVETGADEYGRSSVERRLT